MVARGVDVSFDAVLADVHARDARDTGRADAPLLRASDAMLLDNSDMDRDAAIAAAIAFVEGKAGKQGSSEECRAGDARVSQGRSRRSPYLSQNTYTNHT